MKWTIINYPDKLCMEWNVRMEYRHEFFIYMTFLVITINGRFKIELQHLPPWWGLQEASNSPCPEQGLWPYQAPQKSMEKIMTGSCVSKSQENLQIYSCASKSQAKWRPTLSFTRPEGPLQGSQVVRGLWGILPLPKRDWRPVVWWHTCSFTPRCSSSHE